MSAPPLAPAAIHSAPTPVARQRQGQRHQRERPGSLHGERQTKVLLCGICLVFKKVLQRAATLGQSS